ncbi:hypothetical protein [Bacillus nitroreducens]
MLKIYRVKNIFSRVIKLFFWKIPIFFFRLSSNRLLLSDWKIPSQMIGETGVDVR